MTVWSWSKRRSDSIDRATPLSEAAIAEFLRRSFLFRDGPPEVARKVAPHIEVIEAPAGTLLVRAGTHEQSIGIMMQGTASVSMSNPESVSGTTLFTIGVGDHFGEVGLLLGASQPHDVIAEQSCVVLTLREAAVTQLCEKIPSFAQAMAASLAARLVKTSTSRPPPPPRSGVSGSDRGAALPRAGETVPFVRVSSYGPLDSVIDMVPVQIIQQHRMIPLELRDRVLTVGMVDPFNEAALRELAARAPKCSASCGRDFRGRFHHGNSPAEGFMRPLNTVDAVNDVDPNAVLFDEADSRRDSERSVQRAGEQVVALAAEVVAAGLERGASDIHLEPERGGVRIRFRVNGLLSDWEQTVQMHVARGADRSLQSACGPRHCGAPTTPRRTDWRSCRTA